MTIPDAYYIYASSFYPSLSSEVSSVEEFISRGLEFLSDERVADLQAFLPRALAGGCTVAELQQAWMSAGPMFACTDRDLPAFLQLTVHVIASEGSRSEPVQHR